MINPQEATSILKMMFYIRYTEEKIANEYKKGYMKCPVHLYVGQEAIATGICLNLLKEDYITSNHRSHGHYLAKGGDLRLLLDELCGLSTGCSKGWGGSQHLYSPEVGILGTSSIVGGGIAIGTGIAFAIKKKKLKNVSVIFFGDGATEEGYFYESLNFASLKSLPVLYVCENNLFATHSRIEKRRHKDIKIYKLAEGFGIESAQLDGNDVVSIYETGKEIINKIRETQKPCFIEALTYRWKGHVSPDEDFAPGYRSKEELESWKNKCPVKRFKRFAIEGSLLTEEEIKIIENETITYVNNIFKEIESSIKDRKAILVPKTPY